MVLLLALEFLERYLEFFAVFKIFVFSTISRENPKNVLRSPGWKTLSQTDARTTHCLLTFHLMNI